MALQSTTVNFTTKLKKKKPTTQQRNKQKKNRLMNSTIAARVFFPLRHLY